MLKHALVGAGIVFLANLAAQSDFVVAKAQADPNGWVWPHANVLVGAVGLVAAHKLHLIG